MKSNACFWIPAFILIGIVFIGGCIQQEDPQIDKNDKSISESDKDYQKPLPSASQNQGLGSLCLGEDSCREFCSNNIKICQEYCQGKKIKLCAVIFPPGDNEDMGVRINQQENCISNPSPVFTHAFVDITKIFSVSQYGNNAIRNPGSQARSYVALKEGESTPVYAPTNFTITRIYFSDKKYVQSGKEIIRPEYRINFQISCEVEMAYDHIISLADKFKEYAPQIPAPGKNDGVAVSIQVQAGELIGYTSGSFPGRAFDFLLLNKARPHPHLNPARWVTDHSLYKTCPYDYFIPKLKQQYYALIEEENGARSCGPRVKEVPNTPLGYWFQGDATESTGPRFAIYESNAFVEWTLIKGSESPIAYRTQDKILIHPETLTEGKSACYYDKERNAHLYLKMLANDKLGLVNGSGECPSGFPAEYEIWVR